MYFTFINGKNEIKNKIGDVVHGEVAASRSTLSVAMCTAAVS